MERASRLNADGIPGKQVLIASCGLMIA